MAEYQQIANIIPHLKNPQKCKSQQVSCRSGWEIKFILQYLDINENILEWTSEDVVIPYTCGTDGRRHRYFMDFWVKAKKMDGSISEMLIEIKPYNQTVEPPKPKRMTRGAINGLKTWVKNSSKWKATELFCEQQRKQGKDIQFVIITEKDAPFFLK